MRDRIAAGCARQLSSDMLGEDWEYGGQDGASWQPIVFAPSLGGHLYQQTDHDSEQVQSLELRTLASISLAVDDLVRDGDGDQWRLVEMISTGAGSQRWRAVRVPVRDGSAGREHEALR